MDKKSSTKLMELDIIMVSLYSPATDKTVLDDVTYHATNLHLNVQFEISIHDPTYQSAIV